jgi:hypothetical protein
MHAGSVQGRICDCSMEFMLFRWLIEGVNWTPDTIPDDFVVEPPALTEFKVSCHVSTCCRSHCAGLHTEMYERAGVASIRIYAHSIGNVARP